MKTYKDYIFEDYNDDKDKERKLDRIYTGEYLPLYGQVYRFVQAAFDPYAYSSIENDMINGKFTDEISQYDIKVKKLKEFLKIFEDSGIPSYQRTVIPEAQELLKKYDKAVIGYKKAEKMYKEIFSYLKIGEPIKSSVKKVAQMTSKVKFYYLRKLSYSGTFFDVYSEEDILRQIEEYNGTVKLNGVSDLYVVYKNGKLERYHF